MRKSLFLGLIGACLVAGCGYNHIGAEPAKATQSAPLYATQAVGMRSAFGAADAYARAELGDDFQPIMAFGQQVFDPEGNPRPGSWQFNMVGHMRGQTGFSYVKIKVGPQGDASVDPKTGGPFPDRNKHHLLPRLDMDAVITAENGMRIVMNQGYGKKYPPSYPVSWELRPSDRLQQTVMTYRWAAIKDGTKWWCDTALNPITGKVVENNAVK